MAPLPLPLARPPRGLHSVRQGYGLGAQIDALDEALFGYLPAQLTSGDRRSLLALQAACRAVYRTFVYLEIGSHLGGSLQVLVRDPSCAQIISIDARPEWQPDERGLDFAYRDNSTKRMLDGLAGVPGADVSKIETFDFPTSSIPIESITATPKMCLIDGEHTDRAALGDARFCRAVCKGYGCIVFHDAQIIYRAIGQFLGEVERDGLPATAYLLPDHLFVVELGESPLVKTAHVADAERNGYKAFLAGLEANEPYRAFFNRRRFRVTRRLRALLRPASDVR
jgi:hypothetical protein